MTEPPTSMIHTVYFWLDRQLTSAEVTNFVTGAKALGAAPTVQSFFGGGPADTKQRDVTDHSFDYSIHLHFASVADHEAYQVDPVHLKFVAEQAHKFATVKVYDSKA
ncbi:Dabb family protein [Neolewinella antarctica]|uniref:Stress-response A/B barrel domain-containing protein n=1 Tax=Neolewinella antarctica TaxID=442734 RepID=A0ABX0X6V6_9BACT|nr:Dabb family protein [Neolewinella antarctica]NJC24969.1 hypothetical protein [Neolewinella antarctica]